MAAPAAFAAPDCLTDACEGAASAFSNEDLNILLAVAIFIGFLALVALLPDFDGTEDSDWDTHGGDDFWRH
jgi:hypothetical protein